jgi:hypothetical protein
MRRPAVLLAVAAALSIPLTGPAPASSATVPRTEVICQDWSIFPQYIRHIFLSVDNPTAVRDFDEHPDNLGCYEWSGSTPATVAYTISYVSNGQDYPDGATGILTMGHGFGWNPPMPGYVYRASFTLIP